MRCAVRSAAWEPVIYRGGRQLITATRRADSIVCGVAPLDTLPGRVIGAKPAAVCRWIFTLLGACPGDTLDDLFPGSGAVGRAWAAFTSSPGPSPKPQADAFVSRGRRRLRPRRPGPRHQLARPVRVRRRATRHLRPGPTRRLGPSSTRRPRPHATRRPRPRATPRLPGAAAALPLTPWSCSPSSACLRRRDRALSCPRPLPRTR